MAIFNGGGVSGVSPQKFDTDIGEVKNLIQNVDQDVEALGESLQSDMTQLVTDVNDAVDEMQTTINNAPVGGPLPYMLNKLTAASVEEGIKLDYQAVEWEGTETATNGMIRPYGVMIRYSDEQYPRTPSEGILAVDDTDLFDETTTGTNTSQAGKEKTATVVGFANNTLYYFSAFTYSYAGMFNTNYYNNNASPNQLKQRTTCTYTGNKGSLTVTVTQDYNYKTLGEITATMTPTAGGDAKTGTRTGAGNIAIGNLEAGEYTLSFNAQSGLTTPSPQQITITAGQPNTASAQYKASGNLNDYTWPEIQKIAQDGNANKIFTRGSTKDNVSIKKITGGPSSFSMSNGSYTVLIADFNKEASNSISFMTKGLPVYVSDNMAVDVPWASSNLRAFLEANRSTIIPEVAPYMKSVRHKTMYARNNNPYSGSSTTTDYLYPPSISNMGNGASFGQYNYEDNVAFSYFTNNTRRNIANGQTYVLRSSDTTSWADGPKVSGYFGVLSNGGVGNGHYSHSQNYKVEWPFGSTYYRPLCFCVG